jgi:Putative zinc-finger
MSQWGQVAHMSCASHLGDWAAALVDGELDHDTRDRVLAHLTGCDACRVEIEAMRQLKARVVALSDPWPSAELIGRLLAVGGAASPPPPPVGPGGLGGGGGLAGDPALVPGDPFSPATAFNAGSMLNSGRMLSSGVMLGQVALRASAVLQRQRPAVARRARAVVRVGVRLAAGRPGDRQPDAHRPELIQPEVAQPELTRLEFIRPGQRARLAAVGCLMLMMATMSAAFAMGGQVAGASPTRIVDRVGTDYASAFGDRSGASANGRSPTVADARPGRLGRSRGAVAGHEARLLGASADGGSMPKTVSTVAYLYRAYLYRAYVDRVGPRARVSTLVGTEYLSPVGD